MSISRLRRSLTAALFAVTIVAGVTSAAVGQQDAAVSTWQCLPEETVFAIRIPNGSAVVQALTENTKLGAVLFNNARREKLDELIGQWQEENEENNPLSQLGKYGITAEDLPRFLAGESGVAALMYDSDDQGPLSVALGWVEPGAELAQRTIEAIGELIEDQQEEEHPPQRIDLQLAGQPVMQITVPVASIEYGDFTLPDNLGDLSDEEREQAYDKALEKYYASRREQINFRPCLVTALGDRLLVAYASDAVAGDEQEETAARLEAMFARLIAAHNGEPGRFASRVMADPEVADIAQMPGVAVMELLGDFPALLKAIRAQDGFQSDPTGENTLRLMGADQLGAFAARMTLDGSLMRTDAFLSAPAPRRGLLRLLEQPPLPTEPPPFVPASAVSVAQLSFDLGDAYRIVKQEVTKEFEEAAGTFEIAETQTRAAAQVGLEEILDSIGNRHVVYTFEPEIVRQQIDDDADIGMPIDRTALIWENNDEEVWVKLQKASGVFSALLPGVEATEEQGFRGWRIQNEQIEGGLVFGKGHLVYAVGRGVLESALSSLSNPPTGQDAMRESETYRRATRIAELRPGIGFQLTDSNRSTLAARQMFKSLLDDLDSLSEDFGDDFTEQSGLGWLAIAGELFPSEAELENIFGVSVTSFHVTRDGLRAQNVHELPAE